MPFIGEVIRATKVTGVTIFDRVKGDSVGATSYLAWAVWRQDTSLYNLDRSILCALANLRTGLLPTEELIDNLSDIVVDSELVYIENFDNDIKCRRSFPLEHTLLGSTPPSLFITECNGLDAADQVTERRVEHQIFKRIAMSCTNKLYTAFSDGSRGKGFLLGTDFIDDHNLGHVVFNGFNHDGMLKLRSLYLHPACASDGWMWDVAISGDFVGCIHDDHPAAKLIGDDARSLPKLSGFTNAWATKEEDGLSAFDNIPDDVNRSVDASANAARQANDFILAVSNG
jgi:hypothetical protein